jgi:hypothetical protein
MDRLLVAGILIAVAALAALVLRRRRPEPPTQARWEAPAQLDRSDFDGADQPWLVVVFTSATCDSCVQATAKASVLRSPQVAYQEVSYQTDKTLHERYAVDVVPMTLLADRDGVVRTSFIGAAHAADLWAAVAAVRDPGADQ